MHITQTKVSSDPRLSIQFRSQRPTKATVLTDEPIPVHNKSNIKFNTRICLPFMYITRKKSNADPRLINNLIVSSDTSIFYWPAVLTGLQIGKLWNEAAIDCQRAISDGMISVECSHTSSIRTCVCKFRTAIKTLGPLHTFVSWNP